MHVTISELCLRDGSTCCVWGLVILVPASKLIGADIRVCLTRCANEWGDLSSIRFKGNWLYRTVATLWGTYFSSCLREHSFLNRDKCDSASFFVCCELEN